MDFGVFYMKVNGNLVKLQIWDTAGQEAFRTITRVTYRAAKCILLTYDITNRESFDGLPIWMEEIHNNKPETCHIYLASTKADMEEKAEVSYEEGISFAKKN